MAQTIQLKRSSVAGNVPGSSDLSLGEIAINTADGAVYIKKGNNDIVAVHDNDILHIDTSNSRVGIGTTSPSNSLHVVGSVKSTGDYIADTHFTSSDSNVTLSSSGSGGYVYLRPNGKGTSTGETRIDSDGLLKVNSIGTSYGIEVAQSTNTGYAPASILLKATQSNARGGGIYSYNTQSDNGWYSGSLYNNTNLWAVTFLNGTSFNPAIAQMNYAKLLVNGTTGHVGINTSNPLGRLSIHDDSDGNNPHAGNTNLYLQDDNALAINNGGSIVFSGIYTSGGSHLGYGPYIKAYKTNATDNNYSFGLKFATRQNGVGSQVVGLNITHDQKVGIGANITPDELLHVKGTNGAIAIDGNGSSNTASIKFINDNERSRISSNYDSGGGGRLTFHTDSTGGSLVERLRINNSGNVGIGTTGPAEKLHVNGNLRLGNDPTLNWSSNHLTLQPAADVIGVVRIYGTSSYSPRFEIFSDAGSNKKVQLQAGGTSYLNGGNVGINTASPQYKFHVNSGTSNVAARFESTDATAAIQFKDNTGEAEIGCTGNDLIFFPQGAEKVRLKANGALGIGTASPLDLIHVKSSSTDARILIDGHTDADAELKFAEAGSVKFTAGFDAATDKFVIGTSNVDTQKRFTINSSGAITFNEAFTFPTADGSANQVLQTDGSGNLTFATVSGGSGTITGVSNMADNRVITAQGSTTINAESNLTFNGSTLDVTGNVIIDTNPAATYGVSEALRIDDVGNTTDRQLQFFELCNSGARSHRLAYNTNITSTGSAYVHTQGNYGGSSQIEFGNSGAMIFYVNSQVTGGSTTAITPTERFRLESDGKAKFTGDVNVLDNKQIQAGTGGDLFMTHNGTNSFIQNKVGGMYIEQATNDGNMIFRNDDGSGGLATYMTLEGGNERVSFSKSTNHADGVTANFGTGNDMQIYHDGTNGSINNFTGDLLLRQNVDNADILLQSDNGSGGLATYFQLDGSQQQSKAHKNIVFFDDIGAYFGGGADLRIKHDGTDSSISNATGDLNITCTGDDIVLQSADDVDIKVQGGEMAAKFGGNGGVDLYHNNVQKLSTTADGVTITGNTTGSTLLLSVNEASNSAGPILDFNRDSASPADADYLGQLKFRGENDADQDTLFAKITAKAADVSDGTEDGAIEFMTKKAGANNIAARLSANNLDLINGTGLSVAGNATITGNLTVNGSTTTISTATLDVEDKNITLNKGSGDTSSTADGAGITIQDAVNSSTDATLLWESSTDSWQFSHRLYAPNYVVTDTNAVIYRNSNDLELKTYAGYDINLMPAGNVGIGTTSPSSKLTVEGDIRQTTGDLLYHGGGNWDIKHLANDQNIVFYTSQSGSATEKMRIKADGKVGIGTSSLTNKFHVSGDARIEGSLMAGGASATNVPARPIHIKSSGDAAAIRIEDTTSSNLAYDIRSTHGTGLKFIDVTNSATRMTLTDGGEVAINADTARTTGGTARLTIADSASCINMGPSNSDLMYIRRIGAGQFQMQTYNNNNSGNLELQPYGGKVGIGTGSSTNPQATFQVEEYGIDTTTTSTTATTQVAIHSFAAATFRSARFTVQVTNSTDSTYHTTELLLVHDGTTANITEFGEIHTGNAKEATFDADISGSNVRLLATPASTDSMAFKVVAHAITT